MLRPTFLAFETAKKAITAGQYALDTVGHNLSNMEVEGYTRQRVDLASFHYSNQSRFQIYGQQLPGQGVLITGISQIRDPSLDVRYREESANWGELAVTSTGMAELNKIFDEVTTDGIDVQIKALIDAFAKLQTEPSSQDYAMVVRTSAEQVTQLLNIYAKDVDRVEQDQLSDLGTTITEDANLVLQQIGKLNEKIEQQHIFGQQPNELLDERNLLIDRLSELMDIQIVPIEVKVSDERSIERMVIKLRGVKDETGGDVVLVKGREYNEFELATDQNNNATIPVEIKMTNNITSSPGYGQVLSMNDMLHRGGALNGYLNILNGAGNFANPYALAPDDLYNEARGIPYYRAAFDELAKTFASVLNDINATAMVSNPDYIADPLDPNYDPDAPEFIPGKGPQKDLFVSSDGGPLTAKNITIAQEWRDKTDYLTVSVHGDNAAAKENDVVALFSEALSSKKYDFSNGYAGSGKKITATFQEYFTSFQAELGLDRSLADTLLATSDKVMGGLMDSRDAISGVSMNEEASNMMMYQNYYNAAIRYLTTLDEAVNAIINNMGLVGR